MKEIDKPHFHETFDIDITLIQGKYKRILCNRMKNRYFRSETVTESVYVILIPKGPISFSLSQQHTVNLYLLVPLYCMIQIHLCAF